MATTSANVAATLRPAQVVVNAAKQATVHRSVTAKASAATKAARSK